MKLVFLVKQRLFLIYELKSTRKIRTQLSLDIYYKQTTKLTSKNLKYWIESEITLNLNIKKCLTLENKNRALKIKETQNSLPYSS